MPPAGGLTVGLSILYDTPYGTWSRDSETALENCPSEVTVIVNWFEYPNPMVWENGDVATVNVDLVVTSRVTVAESAAPPPVPDIVSVYTLTGVEVVVVITRIANASPSAGGVTVLGVKTAVIELGRLA